MSGCGFIYSDDCPLPLGECPRHDRDSFENARAAIEQISRLRLVLALRRVLERRMAAVLEAERALVVAAHGRTIRVGADNAILRTALEKAEATIARLRAALRPFADTAATRKGPGPLWTISAPEGVFNAAADAMEESK